MVLRSSSRVTLRPWWRRRFGLVWTKRIILFWSAYDAYTAPSPCPLPRWGRGIRATRGPDHAGDHPGEFGVDHSRYGALDGAMCDVALHQGEEGLLRRGLRHAGTHCGLSHLGK